jgi:transketolase
MATTSSTSGPPRAPAGAKAARQQLSSSTSGVGVGAAPPQPSPIDETRCVDTVRVLANDCVEAAGSGHPGAPIALAPLAHVLWTRPGLMVYDPADPAWPGRDRFVLSNGHACALLYSMLHLTGYAGMPLDELHRERRLDSVTPGHPESVLLPGAVEVTTGPLGQGVANAVGLAIAATRAFAEFNDANVDVVGGGGVGGVGTCHAQQPQPLLCDSHVFCVCGDGCMMEGVASEAASFAGHAGLGRLTLIYDSNHTTIDGEAEEGEGGRRNEEETGMRWQRVIVRTPAQPAIRCALRPPAGDTSLAFTEDVPARFEAYGWHVQVVGNGDTDLDGIHAALAAAKASTDRPSLVVLKTTNGYGSTRQGTHKVREPGRARVG